VRGGKEREGEGQGPQIFGLEPPLTGPVLLGGGLVIIIIIATTIWC